MTTPFEQLTARRDQDIVAARAEGMLVSSLADSYRVTQDHIRQILRRARVAARHERGELILRACLDGVSVFEISLQHDLSPAWIYRILRRRGVLLRNRKLAEPKGNAT